MDTKGLDLHEAFQDEFHSRHFDARYKLNLRGLKKEYESFNEFKLLLRFKSVLRKKIFLELGCATGELYRYIKHYHEDFIYYGLDISEPAINRARAKYPSGNFFLINENNSICEEVKKLQINPNILFVRDVVIHQIHPFEFLRQIIQIPKDLVILRVRTRDKGNTVLDPELSCQFYCGKWVPYLVLNIDELIDIIRSCVKFETLCIIKNYMQLGGYHSRYLPKECFYSDTGTAETAVLLKKSDSFVKDPKIEIEQRKEEVIYSNVFCKKPAYLIRTLLKKIVRV